MKTHAVIRRLLATADFNERDHPRGQPENRGEFAPKSAPRLGAPAARPSSQRLPAPSQTHRLPAPVKRPPPEAPHNVPIRSDPDAVLKHWKKGQPVEHVDDILEKAEPNQQHLVTFADRIAERVDHGTELKNPGIKSREGLERKVHDGKHPKQITDAVRLGFNLNTDKPELADLIVSKLASDDHLEVVDEGWRETEAGYFDRTAKVRFPDGIVGEVQIWPPGMLKVKNDVGHKLYERCRVLEATDPEAVELTKQMCIVYGAVRKRLGSIWDAIFSNQETASIMEQKKKVVDLDYDGDQAAIVYHHNGSVDRAFVHRNNKWQPLHWADAFFKGRKPTPKQAAKPERRKIFQKLTDWIHSK